MTTIFGHNEAEARMKRETMEPKIHVSIDHDFYSEEPERHRKKKSHREKHRRGDSICGDDRDDLAMGGVAKKRRHYPNT